MEVGDAKTCWDAASWTHRHWLYHLWLPSILLVVGVCWWHIIHHENMRCILRFKRSLGITSLQLRIFDFFLSFAKFLKAMGRKSWRLEVFSSQPVFLAKTSCTKLRANVQGLSSLIPQQGAQWLLQLHVFGHTSGKLECFSDNGIWCYLVGGFNFQPIPPPKKRRSIGIIIPATSRMGNIYIIYNIIYIYIY